jgi:hypothetical protein
MEATISSRVRCVPWNKDKAKEIWATRIRLQLGAQTRDVTNVQSGDRPQATGVRPDEPAGARRLIRHRA